MSIGEDPFLARAKSRVEGLVREASLLAAQEEGVRRRRLELQVAAAELERAIALYVETMGIGPEDAPGQITAALDAPQGSLADLAGRFLSDRKSPAKVNDVVRWLAEVGRLSDEPAKAGQNYSQVYTTLLRHPERFVRVGRGAFKVTEGASGAE